MMTNSPTSKPFISLFLSLYHNCTKFFFFFSLSHSDIQPESVFLSQSFGGKKIFFFFDLTCDQEDLS